MPTNSYSHSIRSRIRQYISALDTTGNILTLLGLLPTLIDLGAKILGYDIPFPAWALSLWFIIAFGIANIRIFEARSDKGLVIHILDHDISLRKWLSSSGNKLSIDSRICLALSAKISIANNEELATHVRIVVSSVDSEYIPSDDLRNVKLTVDRFVSKGDVRSGNPFSLAAHEINDHVQIQGEIPLQIPAGLDPFAYIGSLSHIFVDISFERAGREPITHQLTGDVAQIRRSIENSIVEKAQHSHPNGDMPRQMLNALRNYWRVADE